MGTRRGAFGNKKGEAIRDIGKDGTPGSGRGPRMKGARVSETKAAALTSWR